jgi:hypothetical protein
MWISVPPRHGTYVSFTDLTMRIPASPDCPQRNPWALQPPRPDTTPPQLASHLAGLGMATGGRIADPSEGRAAADHGEMPFTRSTRMYICRSCEIRTSAARPDRASGLPRRRMAQDLVRCRGPRSERRCPFGLDRGSSGASARTIFAAHEARLTRERPAGLRLHLGPKAPAFRLTSVTWAAPISRRDPITEAVGRLFCPVGADMRPLS